MSISERSQSARIFLDLVSTGKPPLIRLMATISGHCKVDTLMASSSGLSSDPMMSRNVWTGNWFGWVKLSNRTGGYVACHIFCSKEAGPCWIEVNKSPWIEVVSFYHDEKVAALKIVDNAEKTNCEEWDFKSQQIKGMAENSLSWFLLQFINDAVKMMSFFVGWAIQLILCRK